MIPSPYQDDLDKLQDERQYFSLYDDLPASITWMHTMGTALGKMFGVTVQPASNEWEIDYDKKEMRCGSIENIYTRRGVLGLLLNGIGRLAFGIKFPQTTKEAQLFAASHLVDEKVAKHFGALSRFVDEIRTDDEIAHQYAGGERVVDTMHAQAYEGATEGLRMMAMDMKVRREMARSSLEWFREFMNIVDAVNGLEKDDVGSKESLALKERFKTHSQMGMHDPLKQALIQSFWDANIGSIVRDNSITRDASGRFYAGFLFALYPDKTQEIMNVLVRSYPRNVAVLGNLLSYKVIYASEEKQLIEVAREISPEIEELKQLASHSGGHAQYVLAKAEQYYHARTLGIQVVTPFFGYDMEAKALDVEAANDSAWDIAEAVADHGVTKDVGESIKFTKDILEKLTPYPFLDLNDRKKEDPNGSMSQRVMGAGKGGAPKKKRKKEREKKSQEERSKDRRKMEGMDNSKNQKEVDKKREGYSILDQTSIDPLRRYLYIIGPYLNRISAVAAKMRRILKVNDPMGLRGANRRGKALNTKVLYRHRLDDYKLFARKEVDKDMSYGFALTGDLSNSTESPYAKGSNRMIEDEILASAFLITEVAERIGEKIMCSVNFFSNDSNSAKRAGFYLSRAKIISDIKEHGGGTNVEAAGEGLVDDLQELEDFKIKNKTIVFITDGSFDSREFLVTVSAAKKYKASIAYFSICEDVRYGVGMCKELEKFVEANAKGVRVRTRNITTSGIAGLPEAIAQLMKETITAKI